MDDDDVTWNTDTSAAAAAARAAEQLTDGAASMVTATLPGEEPPQPPSGALASLALSGGGDEPAAAGEEEDDEEEEEDLVESLRAFAASHGAAQVAAQLLALRTQGTEHRMHTLVFASLSAASDAPSCAKQLAKAAPLFALCARDDASRAALLASLECWLAAREDEGAGGVAAAAKGLAAGLHALYDADALDEPAIVAWFDNASAAKKFGVPSARAAAVRTAAAAFVDWLKNAESEDEDDD